MLRSELIARLAQRMAISIPDASHCVAVMLDGITDAIARGKRVEIRGFGSLHAKQRSGRVGINPATQAKVTVPPKRHIMFRPGGLLRARVINTALVKKASQATEPR